MTSAWFLVLRMSGAVWWDADSFARLIFAKDVELWESVWSAPELARAALGSLPPSD